MDDNIRNRFRSTQRRDYVGPLPQKTAEPSQYVQPEPQTPQTQQPPAKYHNQFEPPKKKRSKLKIFLIVLLILGLIGGGAFAYWNFKIKPNQNQSQETDAAVAEEPAKQEEQPENTTLRLVATGDMIAHTTVLENGKKPDGTYDFSPMMKNMEPYFKKAQVRFCNQATPAGGAQFGLSGYPVFNAPLEWPRAIEGVGCNVINIGTNHTNDKGQSLIDATVAAWDGRENVLAVVGANRSVEEQAKIRYFEQSGVKFSILSYTTYTNNKAVTPYGINMYNKETATKQVAEARANSDIVIVSMRWGTEYSPNINAEQEVIAQDLANAGTDVIFGHGPHVLEPAKIIKRSNGNSTFVWYSIGNFLNTQLETEALIGGFAVMDINIKTKQFVSPAFLPTYMHYEWSPSDKQANNLPARKNLQMYVLDQAAEPMSKSQIGTTVEAQTDRVTKLLNTFTPVKILKSSEY